MDILERLEASPLGAAARRLTFGQRPAAEPPDDTDLLPTVPAPADDVGGNERPYEPSSPELADIRRDLDSVTSQMTHLTDLVQGLQAMYRRPAASAATTARPPDRPTVRQPDRQTTTARPTAAATAAASGERPARRTTV